ncbi:MULTISPECIES: 2-isopropylmalate synthase [Methanothermobacter]|uniref:Putative (R)-citramalate synthase CimA n=2 Tax=Methanothermobacter TaxID=145260 RepID=A0A371NDQ7_9EURY|nr:MULTISPECIES: 2-isopropylmalate synthase [Methanothermobacter]MBC7111216.1 2-isopropylmalate synthase [Methanothermobacter sp.]REE28637.1 (R)-citramalate synthase [Methanothermobacter defluvii]WBF06957.1 2-isopropylmalate synthase [Methanothermobacter thermautotrophicus]WBF08755.1 2-isopropylmalate synthase [Methanothermobacter thermautotrophicus]HIH64587.1 2-isopropylmalate synthase [Methanothermobacter thermautotrophicus]
MQVRVLDTTLRDGEQTPGVSLTPEEKLRIALKIDALGADIIEAGSAITSEGEREGIRKITSEGLRAEICSFARAVREDIDAAISCDVDSVHLVVPTSDLHLEHKLRKTREEVLEQAVDCTEYAVDHGILVELSAEDSTRSDMDFLRTIFREGIEAGAERICACDTVGILTPERSYEFYRGLSELGAPLSVHCHNDFGLAVANSLAGLRAGASEVHATINGIGERAGNAALEEVVVALKSLYDVDTSINIEMLYETSRMVARMTGVYLQPNKAIVGENAFAHESGIHADGVLKKAETYEPITPEMVGHRRRFVMGKHIGTHALRKRLDELGMKVADDKLMEIFRRVKTLGDMGKCVTDVDLQAIAEDVLGVMEDKVVDLQEVTIVSGNRVTPTASVKLRVDDREVLEAGTGVGPVDAAIVAIKKSLEDFADITLEEYHVDAITGGTDALIDVVIKLRHGDRIISARSTQPDIIMASVEAFLSGVNRLLANEKSEGTH